MWPIRDSAVAANSSGPCLAHPSSPRTPRARSAQSVAEPRACERPLAPGSALGDAERTCGGDLGQAREEPQSDQPGSARIDRPQRFRGGGAREHLIEISRFRNGGSQPWLDPSRAHELRARTLASFFCRDARTRALLYN